MNLLVKIISKILNGVIALALASMVIVVFMNVFLRYVMNLGITWSEEIARYLFVWIVFLGAIMAFKDKGHLGLDLLVGAVPKKLQKVLFLISNIVVIAILILLVDGLIKMIILDSGMVAPATEIPINLLPLAGLISAICMIVLSVLQTIQFVFLDKNAPPWVKSEKNIGEEKEDFI